MFFSKKQIREVIFLKTPDKKVLLWLHNHTKEIYLKIIVLTFIGIFISRLSVQFALQSKTVLDLATSGELSKDFYISIGQLIFLVLFQLGLQSFFTVINVETTCKYSMHMREKVFNTLLSKDWQSVTAYHTGELMNRINNDTNIIVNGIMNIIPNFVSLVSRILFVFLALHSLDTTLTYISLVVGPLVLILTRIYSKKMKSLHKKCMETDGITRSFMLEALQNILVIKTYRNHKPVTLKSREYQQENFKYNMKKNYISILMNILFYLGLTAGYYLAFSYCAFKVAKGIMTVGTLTAVVQLIGQVQTPFKSIASCIPQYFAAMASAERIVELYNMKGENYSSVINNEYTTDNTHLVEINGIYFSYDNNEIIFENADFSMKKGEIVTIGGISGIGKSTLLKLIMGILKPQKGSVKVNIKAKNNAFSSYVPQGNMILSGTIKENIAFYREINEERITEAAKTAQIYDFISQLPDGFDTVLGEKGLGLSEGQIQRIAIARAIYFDAPLLILDEATSALDENTELQVLKNIKESGKSCIIISHKKASFEICDKIIRIENKKIITD